MLMFLIVMSFVRLYDLLIRRSFFIFLVVKIFLVFLSVIFFVVVINLFLVIIWEILSLFVFKKWRFWCVRIFVSLLLFLMMGIFEILCWFIMFWVCRMVVEGGRVMGLEMILLVLCLIW